MAVLLGGSRARRSLVGVGLVALLASALTAVRVPTAVAADPVVMGAGDIACDPADPNFNGGAGTASACRMRATSDLLVAAAPAAVLPLGDNQYEDGALAKYQQSYDPSWGRVKAVSRPIPGDGDYGVSGAAGYFDYFGAAAGTRGKGYYSYDVGAWHVVALNSACQKVGGCGPGSPQEQWLRADLAAHPADCILAYFHKPRFASGTDFTTVDTFWRDLYAAGAEIVLSGDRHIYERFAPQNPDGAADPKGIREFIVGTGGKNLGSIGTVQANSQVRAKTFGALKLTLHAGSYDWNFVPAAGQSFTDAGSTACSAASPPPTTTTMAPTTTSSTTTTTAPTTTTSTTTTTTAPPSGQTFTPNKDTYVSAGSPTSNFGGGTNLQVRSGARIAFIGFSVAGTAGVVPRRAILRLTVGTDTDAGSDDGGAAYQASDDWQETSLTWNTYQATPGLVGPAITGSVGAVNIGQTVDFDVTPVVTGDGRYDFAIQSGSADLTKYLSRERGAKGPTLILEY